MRVLAIGQLPKEVGGNYTTGAANVLYELSKQTFDGCDFFTFGTNMPYKKAVKASAYPCQYIGYRYCLISILTFCVLHPIQFLKRLYHYYYIDNENPLRMLFYEENIRSAIKQIDPDIIHVHSIGNLSVAHFAKGRRSIPIILTCHGIFYRGDPKDERNRRRYLGNLKFASVYTGLTQESLFEYEKYLGIDKPRVKIIPNGVDCSKFFYSPEARQTIRQQMRVDNNCVVFITVASVQKRKGQFNFVKLLEHLNIPYQYWIVGRGEDEEIIMQYVEEQGMKNCVKLLGYKSADELYKYYSAADVYAHVSEKEGQALSELEANATGLRIIVNKSIIGTIASGLSTSNYYVLNMENVDLNGLVQWIISGIAASRVSNQSFSWELIAGNYSQLYKTLI